MSLKKYLEKRNLKKSKEPGLRSKSGSGKIKRKASSKKSAGYNNGALNKNKKSDIKKKSTSKKSSKKINSTKKSNKKIKKTEKRKDENSSKKTNSKKNTSLKSKTKSEPERIFVVQKHDASHLHYDFRLEMQGVLKSWAIPKGPDKNPTIKRLAVHVEDHPLEYANFEGIIPKGNYGAGKVEIWDKGTWESKGPPLKNYNAGDLSIILHGKKLKGEWKLIKIKHPREEKKNIWIFFKVKDKYSKE